MERNMIVQVIGRAVGCEGGVLAAAGDNNTERLRFQFDREPVGKVYIKVQPPAGAPFREELAVSGAEAVWMVGQAAAASAGTVVCQLLMEDTAFSPARVWQSEQFRLTVLESLPLENEEGVV